VIVRGAFLAGRYLKVVEEIVAVKEACGTAHLKVISDTGELATCDNVRRTSWLAMLAGGDFIKTSTGKVQPAATLGGHAGDVGGGARLPGRRRPAGRCQAGGIRTTKDAMRYLVLVSEIAEEHDVVVTELGGGSGHQQPTHVGRVGLAGRPPIYPKWTLFVLELPPTRCGHPG
jgi:deoxyribose-phosphate aldolase